MPKTKPPTRQTPTPRYKPVNTGNMWAIQQVGANVPALALCWTQYQARKICRALNASRSKKGQ